METSSTQEEEEDIGEFQHIEIETKPIHRRSRFRTFIDLTNALLGAGVIVVSSTFKTAGLAPATLLLLFSCFICYISGCLLISLQCKTNTSTLEELACHCFGRGMKIAVAISDIISTACFTASYLVIGADQIESWLSLAGVQIKGYGLWVALLAGYAVVVPVLLTIPRRIVFLVKFQTITILLSAFYAIAILVRAIMADAMPAPTVAGFKVDLSLFTVFGTDLMTFSMPTIMMPVLQRYNPHPRKRETIMGGSLVFCFLVISVPGVLGYLMTGDGATSDILKSFSNSDTLMIVVRVAMFCVATFSYPMLNAYIVGSIGAIVFENSDPSSMTLKQRAILIPVVNVVSFIAAMVSNDIQPILGFGGAVGMCFLGIMFPAMCKLKRTERRWWSCVNIFYVVLAIFGICMGVVCGGISIRDLVASYKVHTR